MSRRSLVVVWAVPWVVAAACGGRTGEDLPSTAHGGVGVGSGGSAALGGASNGEGGVVGQPKPATGGRNSVPPATGRAGTGPNVGGTVTIGAGGFVNVAGAVPVGGFGSGGAPNGCLEPTCMCPDCYSECVCRLGALGSAGLCKSMCFGAGGSASTGGVTGSGGATACFLEDAGVSVLCPTNLQYLLPTCCTPTGCGYLIQVGANPGIPLEGGCEQFDQAGVIDGRCPSLGELIGNPQAGGPVGCCRSDGLCGLTLEQLGIGCVKSTRNGVPFSCSSGIVDAGPG